MGNSILGNKTIDDFHTLVKNSKAVVIFGAGEIGYLVQNYLKQLKHPASLFIDNNERKQGKQYHAVKIVSPFEGVQKYPHDVFIVANLNLEHGEQMFLQLQKLGVKEDLIVRCNSWMILEMENCLHFQYIKEDKNFIYHHPVHKSSLYYAKKVKAKVKALGYKILMDLVHPKTESKKRYDVAICAIFKNESYYLQEWIEYHKIIGFDHFYLYNNFSDDHYMDILAPYIQDETVTLIEWPYHQGQISAYKDCIQKYKDQCQWIGFVDIDEFVLPVKDKSINSFLKGFEKKRGSVLIYWRLFGSAGRLDRDVNHLVIEDFTVCWGKYSDTGKCFFNTNYNLAEDSKRNNTMHHQLWTEYRGITFPPVNIFDRVCIDGFHSVNKRPFAIQINHYALKSYAEYRKKMQGTDVFFQDNPHNKEAFLFHEEKCRTVDVGIYKYLFLLKQKMGIRE